MKKVQLESPMAEMLGITPGEYDLHELSDGVIALSSSKKSEAKPEQKVEPKPEQKKSVLSSEEITVLKKLIAFRFESRIPYNVNKTLSESEKKILEGLIKRNFVELYKQGKYVKTGVYNISEKVFPLIREAAAKNEPPAPSPVPAGKLNGFGMLQKHGYAIIDNEGEARDISRMLENQIRAGQYLGIRGFNKKFYIAEKSFYVNLSEKIRRLLAKKDLTIGQIAADLKVPEDACSVAIMLMNNESEVIEKKRGMYGLV